MFEQILAGLGTQYPTLPKAFLGILATKMALKVTDATQIEGAIAALTTLPVSVEDLAAEFSKEGDRRATEAVQTHIKKNPTPQPPKPDPLNPNPAPVPPVMSESEKALADQLAAMQLRLDQQDEAKAIVDKKTDLVAKLKEKGVSSWMADNVTLTKDTDIETLLPEIETKFKTIKQELTTGMLKDNSFVPGGGEAEQGQQAVAAAEAKAWAQANNPAPAPAAPAAK